MDDHECTPTHLEDDSLAELFPVAYEEVRRIARSYMGRERREHTLQPTALAHEAYLRLANAEGGGRWKRREIIAAAATAMRRVLVDHAKARGRMKRGGGWQRVTLRTVSDPESVNLVDIISLDRALDRLAADSRSGPRQVRLIELRYLGGLTEDEAAACLDVTARTVRRDWKYAQAWLRVELSDQPPES